MIKKILRLFVVFVLLSLFIPIISAEASTWPGYPKEIEKGVYQIMPGGLTVYTAPITLQKRIDLFPKGAQITAKQESLLQTITDNKGSEYGLQEVVDFSDRLVSRLGKDKVEKVYKNYTVYLLPWIPCYVNSALGLADSDKKEIWISLTRQKPDESLEIYDPSNIIAHEFGHGYQFETGGEDLNNIEAQKIYEDIGYDYPEMIAKLTFGTSRWNENPWEWYAEQFKIAFGYPKRYNFYNLSLADNKKGLKYFSTVGKTNKLMQHDILYDENTGNINISSKDLLTGEVTSRVVKNDVSGTKLCLNKIFDEINDDIPLDLSNPAPGIIKENNQVYADITIEGVFSNFGANQVGWPGNGISSFSITQIAEPK